MKPAPSDEHLFYDTRAHRLPLRLTGLALMTVFLVLGARPLFAAEPDIMGFLEDADQKLSKIQEPARLLQDVKNYSRKLQDMDLEIDRKTKLLEWLRFEQDNTGLVMARDELGLTIREYEGRLNALKNRKASLEREKEAAWRDYNRVMESREKELKKGFKPGATTNRPVTSTDAKICAYCGKIGCPGPQAHSSGKTGVLGDLKGGKAR